MTIQHDPDAVRMANCEAAVDALYRAMYMTALLCGLDPRVNVMVIIDDPEGPTEAIVGTVGYERCIEIVQKYRAISMEHAAAASNVIGAAMQPKGGGNG